MKSTFIEKSKVFCKIGIGPLLGIVLIISPLWGDWDTQLYTHFYGLYGVHGVDSLHVWACGDSGMVARTKDGGETWEWLDIGKRATLVGIWFVDTLIGWVSGDSGTIAKTIDGGDSWVFQTISDSCFEDLRKAQFVDSLRGWVGGSTLCESNLYRTQDGGLTWEEILDGGSFHLLDWGRGFCLYNPVCPDWGGPFLKYTSDSGNSWSEYPNLTPSGDTAWLRYIFFVDEEWGWGAELFGVFFTTNGGKLWIKQEETYEGIGLWFLSRDRGWAVGHTGISEWKDGNWQVEQTPGIMYLQDVWFADTLHGWAVAYYPWFPANEGWVIKYSPLTGIEEGDSSITSAGVSLSYQREGILLQFDDPTHAYTLLIFDVAGRSVDAFPSVSGDFLWKGEKSGIYFFIVKENEKIRFLKKVFWIK